MNEFRPDVSMTGPASIYFLFSPVLSLARQAIMILISVSTEAHALMCIYPCSATVSRHRLAPSVKIDSRHRVCKIDVANFSVRMQLTMNDNQAVAIEQCC